MSEGADCRCKCLVRPLGRGACQRINQGSFHAEDFYTVETITSGPGCKCACVAPPSALNPCEGDFRLQKLREADSGDLKVGGGLEAEVVLLESAQKASGDCCCQLASVRAFVDGCIDGMVG